MSLQSLLDKSASAAEVAAYLNSVPFETALADTRALGRAAQRKLYQLAAQNAPLTIADMVPANRAPCTEVRLHGRNTLPLPNAFCNFEKRSCKPNDGSARIFGYNEGASRPLIGPGYYVGYDTDRTQFGAQPQWRERGGVVVDYYQVPDSAVVDGWPKVVPNSKGLQMLVFQGTRDYIRKVSDTVFIGAAYKGEKALDHYFTLVRQD
jgi:hypothetical protein